MSKKGELLPTFRDFWFVLTPHSLSYYSNREQKSSDKRGEIQFFPTSRVDILPTDSKLHKFVIYSNERTYELAALDNR